VLVLCNYWQEFNKTLLGSSIPRRDAHIIYHRVMTLDYAYRAIIVSMLLLCSYWQEFNKALWESSISR
jgi:hypothetical protein